MQTSRSAPRPGTVTPTPAIDPAVAVEVDFDQPFPVATAAFRGVATFPVPAGVDPAAADATGVEIAHVVFVGVGVVAFHVHVEEEVADDPVAELEADQLGAAGGEPAIAAVLGGDRSRRSSHGQ